MADPDSLRRIVHSPAPFSTWVGIVLLFILFGVIVLAIIGPSPRGGDYEETRAKKRLENLKTSREDAEKALTTYAWVDKNKGVVRIPISRAMELTVAQLARQKPIQAGPIATPAPETQAIAVSTSPAPAGSPKPAAPQPSPQASAPAAQGAAVSSPSPSAAVSPSPAQAQPSQPAPASPAKTS
jgi:hypothetical protein